MLHGRCVFQIPTRLDQFDFGAVYFCERQRNRRFASSEFRSEVDSQSEQEIAGWSREARGHLAKGRIAGGRVDIAKVRVTEEDEGVNPQPHIQPLADLRDLFQSEVDLLVTGIPELIPFFVAFGTKRGLRERPAIVEVPGGALRENPRLETGSIMSLAIAGDIRKVRVMPVSVVVPARPSIGINSCGGVQRGGKRCGCYSCEWLAGLKSRRAGECIAATKLSTKSPLCFHPGSW